MSTDTSTLTQLHRSLTHTYADFTAQIVTFLPTLLGAALILITGFILAITLKIATKKLIGGFDALFVKLASAGALKHPPSKMSYVHIVSHSVFWVVIAFFVTSAANLLGLDMFSQWMNGLITYLPNLIAGLVIVLGGFLLSNIARTTVTTAIHKAGAHKGEALGMLAQVILFFTTLIIGIEQIGVNVQFLTNILLITMGVLLAGGALAFSLGAKPLVANIIGAQYARKHCKIGEYFETNDVCGVLAEVTQTSIVLDTDTGRTIIPARFFNEQPIHITRDSLDTPIKNNANS